MLREEPLVLRQECRQAVAEAVGQLLLRNHIAEQEEVGQTRLVRTPPVGGRQFVRPGPGPFLLHGFQQGVPLGGVNGFVGIQLAGLFLILPPFFLRRAGGV